MRKTEPQTWKQGADWQLKSKEGQRGKGEKKWKRLVDLYELSMDTENGVGIDCGSGCGLGGGGQRGKTGTTVIE